MNWNKKQWILIILLFSVAIIIGPVIINNLFKLQSPTEWLSAEWDSGDALSFYAAIISATLAIYGISLTIQSSNARLLEDIRNNMLPFIVIDFLDIQTKQRDLFSFEITEDQPNPEITEYAESQLSQVYFIIKDDTIESKRFLSGHQKTVIENGGLLNESIREGVIATVSVMYVYLSLLLENCGNGIAVSLRIGLNRANSKNERKYIKPIPLKVGQAIKVSIYSENLKPDSHEVGDYELELFYNDIYGNKYRQSNNIQLCFEANSHYPKLKVDTTQAQEIVKTEV